MKKIFFILLAVIILTGGLSHATPPPPIQGTAAELTAGTETKARSWSPKTLADEFSGAAAEVVNEAVSTANFNGDTTHAASQDALHDYLIQLDTDLDGSLEDEDYTWTGTHDFSGATVTFGLADGDIPTILTLETISGTPVITNGARIGTDDTDHLIDEASNGAGSATLYIGNESILVSGDIGVSVQAYNANTTVLGSTIGASEVDADIATQAELDAVAALVDTDDELIAIINASPSTQIGVPAGGTGAGTFTDGGILLGSGTGAITALGVATNGQIPIGDGTTDPVLATITGTANEITVTNGAGTITLSIPDDSLKEVLLDATNAPTDNYVLTYDSTSGGFTWEADQTGGTTAYNSIGDSTGVGLISFDDGETATYDGAWDTETAITISLNAADLTGDTTALLITAVDNDDANYIPFLIQDDQDGTPDDLFKVDYAGVVTALGGFVGNVTGNASGSAASITGDLDPDQLSGDTVDDNLIDQAIIAGMAPTGSASPGFTAYDSDSPGSDKTAGFVGWQYVSGGDGAENSTMTMQVMEAGALTEYIELDGVNVDIEFKKPVASGFEFGHASDTTITRVSAGQIAVEGVNVIMNGGALGTPSSGDGTNITNVDAATGDSATGFFDTGTIEVARLPAATTSAAGISELAIASEINTGTDATRAVTPDALANSQYGKTTEVDRVPITAFTDGSAPPAAAAVISSADGAFNCRAFDGASNEDALFTWKVPPDIDTTQGIKFSVSGVVGSATAPANTEVIAFSLAGVSIGNSDAAGSVGTPQTSSLTADATYAQYDSLDTAFSSAITITNLTAGETVSFELIRLATTTDTYAQDFHPHTVLIKYVRLHNATF